MADNNQNPPPKDPVQKWKDEVNKKAQEDKQKEKEVRDEVINIIDQNNNK